MPICNCDYCGNEYRWSWVEAFLKFGFNDGEGQVETWQVEDMLVKAGYTVIIEEWGLHNIVITSIKKDGIEQIPYDNPQYRFGYDDPRAFFPKAIVELLDIALPDEEDDCA